MMLTKESFHQILEQVIDDVHPLFYPESDEMQTGDTEILGSFMRTFRNRKTNQLLEIHWNVIWGTPETVQTIFTHVKEI
jgi:hypothetical protein